MLIFPSPFNFSEKKAEFIYVVFAILHCLYEGVKSGGASYLIEFYIKL